MRETSPHTRGKLDPDTVLGLILGNIPAYAGKAHCRQGGNAQRQKHPRIRGESLIALLNICFLRETSPHTRGKLRTLGYIESKRGNIPAYAGKAMKRMRKYFMSRKHPRIRGESQRPIEEYEPKEETSPHTRGKPDHKFATTDVSRKHPRIRGESISLAALTIMQLETSPHTRGKPLQTGISLQSRRNIPAYAGKAAGHFRLTAASRKHPRIRGESVVTLTTTDEIEETSPHTRGKLERRSLY